MIKKEKKPNNKPAFNNYWIYGALIVFFIAVNFIGVGSNNPSNNQINPSTFEKFLNNGDVSRIVVINKNKAQVTLTNEAFLSPETKNKVKVFSVLKSKLFTIAPTSQPKEEAASIAVLAELSKTITLISLLYSLIDFSALLTGSFSNKVIIQLIIVSYY